MVNLNYENERFLNVVDENDEVIDSKSRIDIHRLGLLHREIHVWMFDENKNIFFQTRGLDRPSAGLLDATVGGHVNKDEDYLEAAVRETKEETDISISPSDLIFIKKFKVSHLSKDEFGGTINNFIRSIYIYKKTITEKNLRKEAGIPGGGFKKFSYEFLSTPPKGCHQMFHKFIFKQELPYILKYLQ